jgi:HEAT repeat protein
MFGVFLALGLPIVFAGTVLLRSLKKALTPTLKKMQEEKDVPNLIKVLNDIDEGVRQEAADTLGQIRNKQAVEPLVAMLKDSESKLREAAAGALVQIGQPSVEQLVAALNDESVDVRTTAAQVLGQIGDMQAVEPLVKMVDDDNKGVRTTVVQALVRIGDPRAVQLLLMEAIISNDSQRNIDGLVTILEHLASDVEVIDLRTIVDQKDKYHTKTERYRNPLDDDDWQSHEITVWSKDYRKARQLAREELVRRGLET